MRSNSLAPVLLPCLLLAFAVPLACSGNESSSGPREGDGTGGMGGETGGLGGESGAITCASGTWDDDDDTSTDCVVHSDCEAGTRVESDGSATTDRSCAPCDEGTFSSESNQESCSPQADCLAPPWRDGESPTTAGTCLSHSFHRVSVSSTGVQADEWNMGGVSFSEDGRFVGFHTQASTLVEDDENGGTDVFIHDTMTGATTRVSVTSEGLEGDAPSFESSLSADGRFVAIRSAASNFVEPDENGVADIFFRDTTDGSMARISVSSEGLEANGASFAPRMSADGRFIAFYSEADNLVADDSNGFTDVFVHDRTTGDTNRISVTSDGDEGDGDSHSPAISSDGRYILFYSEATTLVTDDDNGVSDIFLHDTEDGTTTRVSLSSDGEEGNAPSAAADMSPDGRYVTFYSEADNLVPGDTNEVRDVFLHDTSTGTTIRVSISSSGEEGNAAAGHHAVAPDGSFVIFGSEASNLDGDDTNEQLDLFFHDVSSGETSRISVTPEGEEGNDRSWFPVLSPDGRSLAFSSRATNLIEGDTNEIGDIYVLEIP